MPILKFYSPFKHSSAQFKCRYGRKCVNVMRCAIWYHLHNLKKVKNTHGEVLILVKLQAWSNTLKQFVGNLPTNRAFKIATKERKPRDCFAWFPHVDSAKHTFDKLTLCSGCISSIFRLAYICTYFNLFFQVIFFVSITF